MTPAWGAGRRREFVQNATAPAEVPNLDEVLNAAREAARSTASRELAREKYLEAVTVTDFSGPVVLEYARHLIGTSQGRGAEEVLALSLARNGAQVDALELYLELVRELNLPTARAVWALRRLAADIVGQPSEFRGALDYAIPHRLTEVLSTVETAGDPVSRTIVRVNNAYIENRASEGDLQDILAPLGENDRIRAHLTVALARGNRRAAGEMLDSATPEAVPMNALRRAIRRARSAGKQKQFTLYLTSYLALRPEDGWAVRLDQENRRRAVSNYQLGKTGFPFPTMAESPAYEPRRDHVFYLLHNSLPHNSAGYATRTHGLLSELNRSGWHVDGVTRLGYPYDMPGKGELPDLPAVERVGNVDYRRLLTGRQIEKKNPLYDYTQRYSESLLGLARSERPSILHAASNHWNGLTAVRTARKLGLPSIYEVRGLWEVTRGSRNPEWAQGNMFQFMARMEADAARGATRVFAITEALKAEMVDRGVDADKISIVPNGVDTSRFSPLARDEELAARLDVSGKTVIGYVGSVLDYEGIELLIEAARQLDRRREDFHVLVVGDGAELSRFQALIQELSLEHVVTFTGRVPHEEVERYYSLIDIAPFPRLPLPVCEMVSPLKPFEAMAMGKAVIASDVAALREIVTPGKNGLLHEKGNAESLIEQLDRLLDDLDLTNRIGGQARAWVVEHRDWRQLAQVIASTYAELVG